MEKINFHLQTQIPTALLLLLIFLKKYPDQSEVHIGMFRSSPRPPSRSKENFTQSSLVKYFTYGAKKTILIRCCHCQHILDCDILDGVFSLSYYVFREKIQHFLINTLDISSIYCNPNQY